MRRWDAVPAELKRQPRWVCWKLVEKAGRKTKMPVCAATGKMASSTDAATWCSFEDAVVAVGRLGASGVGFVFGPDRAYTGLDLDHVIRDGVLDPGYQWVVDAAGTYTEISPSGDGLHLYFRGSKPAGADRCRKGGVEMYDHDRFFTVTGTPFTGCREVACRPDVVERAYRAWIEPVEAPPQPTLADAAVARDDARGSNVAGGTDGGNGGGFSAADLTDQELMDRMLASRAGAEIRALLDGDVGAYGNDHSAADMALCNKLAFWCAGDEARMDRFFRASGLMRSKWDSRRGGTTYGAQTVAEAARRCTEFYRPRRPGRMPSRRAQGSSRQAKPTYTQRNWVEPHQGMSEDTYACSMPAHEATRVDDLGRFLEPFDDMCPPSFWNWRADAGGALFHRSDDGSSSRLVCTNAPWIAMDLVNSEEGLVRALVRVKTRDGVRELAMDRDAILSSNRIVGALAPLGAAVSTANAKEVVRYLTEAEMAYWHVRPRRESARHLGWAAEPLGAFLPYDDGEVRFDATADQASKARPFEKPSGTLGEWVAGMAPARAKSPAFRLVLAASFASPLVSVVSVQAFIVYLWGRSRSGKTPTLKAAGSVWGNPTEGADGYFRTFADTPKSIIRSATLLHDMPVIVDELQAKGSAGGGQAGKRMAVEDLLYSLSLGKERGALNSDRTMMRTGSWRSLTIATGEIPVVGDNTMQGAANRTLEINAEPFADPADAQAIHRLVAAQHGTAGRAFIEALRGNDRAFYEAEFERVRDLVDALAGGHPQAQNVALVAFADALASFYVFSPGSGWEACVDGGLELARWALEHATGGESDTDAKAIQRVNEFFVESSIHFDDGCEMDRLERWGVRDKLPGGGYMWHVFPSALERDLTAHGFDKAKTLRRMADEGLLSLQSGRRGFGKQKRMGDGSRVYCYAIDGPALEKFLDEAHAGDGEGGVATVGAGVGVATAVGGYAGYGGGRDA